MLLTSDRIKTSKHHHKIHTDSLTLHCYPALFFISCSAITFALVFLCDSKWKFYTISKHTLRSPERGCPLLCLCLLFPVLALRNNRRNHTGRGSPKQASDLLSYWTREGREGQWTAGRAGSCSDWLLHADPLNQKREEVIVCFWKQSSLFPFYSVPSHSDSAQVIFSQGVFT